ncbi:hypothetical protein L228DRAFT_271168 [Xylona heveae TC161]|uniref:DUF3533 domain-containing protein n=1 Tax=Xylona heveae (strain CBS 132557 / TC161) TaxID=1328760 RepID=A0A164ZPT1_XYLHT|nr:hypothetical protein L228DRAFT_271168 [Xylona heveae TC161]KZF19352.1 hypothetical protein L228DRAFT_271168 [Xylona heveae TC161]
MSTGIAETNPNACQGGMNAPRAESEDTLHHDNEAKEETDGLSSHHPTEGDHEKGRNQPPKPVGFWDKRLNHVRKEIFLKWSLTTLILCTLILTVLSLYWGVLFHVDQNLSSLAIYVADFDGQIPPYNNGETPIVGPAIVQLMQRTLQESPVHLGYVSLPPSHFSYDPMNVRREVYNFNAWAAVIVNPNATAMLRSAVQNGNSSYDPLGACQVIFTDSRDDTVWYDFVYPLLSEFMTEATSMVGGMWTQQVLQNASNPTALANIQKVPQALSPAIGFSMFNLRPFVPFVAIPAVTIGLIYLIILSFFSFSFYLPIHKHFLQPEGHPPLKLYQMIIWRYVATMAAYFCMSLAYSLISLAFQIPFSNKSGPETEMAMHANAYGKGTFVVYWMLNFVGMAALGLACENVAMLIGQPWTAFWLIFWVISNVSTAFYNISIAPRFYYWGFAWPLHNIVEASRQIIFDLHSRIGLNFGVLFTWVALNTAFFPLCCIFMGWKHRKGIHEYYA